jgi:hypothetical protein
MRVRNCSSYKITSASSQHDTSTYLLIGSLNNFVKAVVSETRAVRRISRGVEMVWERRAQGGRGSGIGGGISVAIVEDWPYF